MWLNFNSITEEHNLVSKAGKTYSAFVIRGTRKPFGEEGMEDYEKVVFDSTAATVIEKGLARPNCSVVQFFQKAVKPGDTVNITFKREGKYLNGIDTLEVMHSRNIPTYEPLPDDAVVVNRDYNKSSGHTAQYPDDIPPYLRGAEAPF